MNRVTPEIFRQQEKNPIVLVLDNIRSGLNVGSAFRTADAFALEKLCLCGITAKPPHREILKTAIGASESVAWEYFESTQNALNSLKEQGYTVLGLEQTDQSVSLESYQPDRGQKYAVVLGNEVKGISNEVLPLLDTCLEIPQFGTKHSLNVSVATGIVVWDLFTKIRMRTL